MVKICFVILRYQNNNQKIIKMAYITRNLKVVGNVASKSEAFKLAWETAKGCMKLQNRLFSEDTMTLRDWFNIIIKLTLKRFYNPVEVIVYDIEEFYKNRPKFRYNSEYMGD